jgi:hypothetical protein
VTYQGYDISGYTFYTEQQDKKNSYQNSGVCVLMIMTLRATTNALVKYKGSRSMTFAVSRFLFSVAIKGVIKDKYGFISIDLHRQGYKSKSFMLAKYVAQVFYVLDTINKRLNVVIPRK